MVWAIVNYDSAVVNYDSVEEMTRPYKVLEQKVIFHEIVKCHFLTRFYKGLGDREL